MKLRWQASVEWQQKPAATSSWYLVLTSESSPYAEVHKREKHKTRFEQSELMKHKADRLSTDSPVMSCSGWNHRVAGSTRQALHSSSRQARFPSRRTGKLQQSSLRTAWAAAVFSAYSHLHNDGSSWPVLRDAKLATRESPKRGPHVASCIHCTCPYVPPCLMCRHFLRRRGETSNSETIILWNSYQVLHICTCIHPDVTNLRIGWSDREKSRRESR